MVVPVLILLTAGTIDAGRMIVARSMLSYAAIVGARTGIASGTASTGAVQTAAVNAAPMLGLGTGASGNRVVVTYTSAAGTWGGRTSGDTVTVTAYYTFNPVLGRMTLLTSKSFVAQSTLTIP